MAQGARLVNKQFNSPIGLYSDQNIQEVITRDSKLLANGVVGIDFQNPQGLSKPGNLQNSAVLRMLEEEDSRQRNGQYTGLQNGFHPLHQHFKWPPEGFTNNQRHNPYSNAKISGTKRVAWPPAREGSEEYAEQPAAQSQGGPQIPLQSSQPATVQPQSYHQNNVPQPSAKNYHEPLSVITNTNPYSQQYALPQSPVQNLSPIGFSNAPSRRWAPVPSPLSPKAPITQVAPLYYAPKQAAPTAQVQRQNSQSKSPLPAALSPKLPSYQANLIQDNVDAQQDSFYTPQQARAVFETKIASPPSGPRQPRSPIQLVPDNIAQVQDPEINFCTPKQARAFFEPATRAAAVSNTNNYNPPPHQGQIVSSPLIVQAQIPIVSPNRELVSPREVIIPIKREFDNPISPVPATPPKAVVGTSAPPREVIIPVYRQASYEQKQPSNPSRTQYQYIQDQNLSSSHDQYHHQQRATEAILPIKIAGQNSSQVPAQQYNPVQNNHHPQQQVPQSPLYYQPPARAVEPPPSIITLRPEAPVSQAPAPVYTSQPATATLKGGKNLRGDKKWPPEDVRDRMSAENQARVDLAQGPACRPRRIAKDYSGFFAQHALNSTYPGYKIPPGTQFYEHQPMI